MPDAPPNAFVVHTRDHAGNPAEPGLMASLRGGLARIGWSWAGEQDLREIERARDQGAAMSDEQRYATRGLGFLEKPVVGDILFYPNVPDKDHFVAVEVAGDYVYLPKDDGLEGGDFRSARPCRLLTPEPIDKSDPQVPRRLRNRLGKPGRFSQIYEKDVVAEFLAGLRDPASVEVDPVDAVFRKLLGQLRRDIHHVAPGKSLTGLCEQLFKGMGFVKTRNQEGPAEAGADLIVDLVHDLLPNRRVGVQVFSWGGAASAAALELKLRQLLSGWQTNGLHFGVLLTTAEVGEEAWHVLRDHTRDYPDRPVKLIAGNDFADMLLRHGPSVFLKPGEG